MAPHLIKTGKIQILGETSNSVVYAVDTDSTTDLARDSHIVLKGGTVWYKGVKPFGNKIDDDETDRNLRKEAHLYEAIGSHPHIVACCGLEFLKDTNMPWALRLERVQPGTNLRQHITKNTKSPPDISTRVDMAAQFAEGVAYLHSRDVVWSDLSTRNALLALCDDNNFQIKLCDFVDSDFKSHYYSDWYGCEIRYCSPEPNNTVGIMKRELFALGSAICEITEWTVPYGEKTDHEEVEAKVRGGEWPYTSKDNPAGAVLTKCWKYQYSSAKDVVADLHQVLSQLLSPRLQSS